MSCNYFQKILEAYLRGDLTEDQLQELKVHGDSCTECSKELSAYKTVIGNIQNLPVPEPPEGYWEKSLSQILEKSSQTQKPENALSLLVSSIFGGFTLKKTLAYSSVLVALVLSAVLVFDKSSPDPSDISISLSDISFDYENTIILTFDEAAQMENSYIKSIMGLDPETANSIEQTDDYLISISEDDYILEVYGEDILELSENDFKELLTLFKNSHKEA